MSMIGMFLVLYRPQNTAGPEQASDFTEGLRVHSRGTMGLAAILLQVALHDIRRSPWQRSIRRLLCDLNKVRRKVQ